jgi:DNA (cytosine-5)-methyltransferase 1
VATSIPVIDLFAGPGGLGEGISSVRGDDGRPVFDIRLSVEKDPIAHRTLSLRAIYRRLSEHGRPPDCYYNYLRGSISRDALLEHPAVREAAREALEESRCAELGGAKQSEIDKRIANALPPGKEWVLIGGPPCQAYSLVGRSRMRSTNPIAFAEDKRHLLYQQYLRIISRHRPAMFVMENVKGLLSSVHDGGMIFQRIISDLKSPGLGLEYEIRSLNTGASHEGLTPSDFIVRAEDYGVPQSRHRVILLGIRKDLAGKPHQPLEKVKSRTSLKIALDGLPAIRSRISREPDSFAKWVSVLEGTERLLGTLSGMKEREIRTHVREAIEKAKGHDPAVAMAEYITRPDMDHIGCIPGTRTLGLGSFLVTKVVPIWPEIFSGTCSPQHLPRLAIAHRNWRISPKGCCQNTGT